MSQKIGILLMNTGSPDHPTVKDVRRFLRPFLMDKRVIDLPGPLRALLVYGIILPRRPARSAKAYQKIWTDNGSPLIQHVNELVTQLRERIDHPIEPVMAYGNPSVQSGIQTLLQQGAEKILLLPLFPHYADATVGSCVATVLKSSPIPLEVVPPFYAAPSFIQAIAQSLSGLHEHILFSYHGLPERQLRKTDPTGSHCLSKPDCCSTPSTAHPTCYRHQCLETTRLVAQAAGLSDDRYSIAFQSRLGRAKWMEPYTKQTLQSMPARGITELAVICPAFFCDCLETLEEIAMRGREIFLNAGGKSFRLIPALNSSKPAVDCLATLIRQQIGQATTTTIPAHLPS
jgi:protoporphyrin/coproporphyrin ferrochelatase